MGRKSRFSREARAEAVRLAREPGNSFDSIGHDLGVRGITVRRWGAVQRSRREQYRRRTKKLDNIVVNVYRARV